MERQIFGLGLGNAFWDLGGYSSIKKLQVFFFYFLQSLSMWEIKSDVWTG